jgi:hypothetical protein
MRAAQQQTRARRRSWMVGCLFMGVSLGAAACSGGDGPNLLGTAQQADFEQACSEELAAVQAEHGWGDAEVVAIEREREDGIDVWGVELNNGVEIEFAADQECRLLEIEHGDDDSDGDDHDDAAGDD